MIRHAPAISSSLAAFVNVLGFGPTVTKAWLRPHSDSVSIFVLNSLKFVPSFFALDSISVATCVFPATLVVANAGVALIIYLRRQQVSWRRKFVVFPGHLHRSAMMHFSHSGRRARHT